MFYYEILLIIPVKSNPLISFTINNLIVENGDNLPTIVITITFM